MLEGIVLPNQWRIAVLARAHVLDILAFERYHFGRCERSADSRFHFDQIALSNALLEVAAHFLETGMAHRPFQRIAHQGALIYHGLTFQIAVAGEGHRRLSMPQVAVFVVPILDHDVHFFL